MSAGGARRGRRDNGLDAAEYAVAGDVDPRVGEHLLDVLAAGGIAAYLQPSADLNPVTRTTTVPPRPVDRLYVDRSHLTTARDYLIQLADEGAPEPARDDRPARGDEPDIDAEWAKIVAAFHTAPAAGSHPWPAAEDVTDPPGPSGAAGRVEESAGPTATDVRRLPYAADVSGISAGRGRQQDEPSLLDGLDTFGADLPDDEEHYTPPPPPPLPRFSKYAVVGVLCIVLGFVFFLSPTVLPVTDPSVVTLLGFTGILAGFVMLILRLRPGDSDEHDPDDGAVV